MQTMIESSINKKLYMGRVKARFKKLNNFGVWWKSNPVLKIQNINSWHCHDYKYIPVCVGSLSGNKKCVFFEANDNLELKQRVSH